MRSPPLSRRAPNSRHRKSRRGQSLVPRAGAGAARPVPSLSRWSHPCPAGPVLVRLVPSLSRWSRLCPAGPVPVPLVPSLSRWSRPSRTARCLRRPPSPDLRAACEGQTLGRWAEQCGNISRVTKTNKPNPAGSPFHLSSFVPFCFSVKVALSSAAVAFQPRRAADPRRCTASFPEACLHTSIHP